MTTLVKMKRHLTERFTRSFRDAPPAVRKAFDKQSRLLLQNPRHPSVKGDKIMMSLTTSGRRASTAVGASISKL